jgi:hypothetical protein
MGILRMLYIINSDNHVPRVQPGNDPLYKICPILSKLTKKFQELCTPEEIPMINETICAFQGCISGYIRRECPKICELCEAKSGYMCDMEAYAGAHPTESDHNSSFSIVNKLCDNIKNKGYAVYMDWWFTCPLTLVHLWTLCTEALYTAVAERKKIKETEESLKTVCKKRCKRSFRTCMMTGWLLCWNQRESMKKTNL